MNPNNLKDAKMLVDSHCHLNMKDFDNDLDAVIQRAHDAGVTHMQTICVKLEDLPRLIEITEKYPNVFASVGVHPHDADEAAVSLGRALARPEGLMSTETLASSAREKLTETLISLSSHPKIIGIGETGLDYYYQHSDRASQKEAFISHIQASQETQLPLIVHTRDADDDTIEILKSEMRRKVFPALIHCFSSSERLAMECVDLGLYISISGIITFKNAQGIRDAVAKVPMDRLLVETDSPYLAPTPMRGKRCEPAYTSYVAQVLADVKGVSLEDVGTQTTENFFRLFSKAQA